MRMSSPRSGPFVLPRATLRMWTTMKITTVHFNTKARNNCTINFLTCKLRVCAGLMTLETVDGFDWKSKLFFTT